LTFAVREPPPYIVSTYDNFSPISTILPVTLRLFLVGFPFFPALPSSFLAFICLRISPYFLCTIDAVSSRIVRNYLLAFPPVAFSPPIRSSPHPWHLPGLLSSLLSGDPFHGRTKPPRCPFSPSQSDKNFFRLPPLSVIIGFSFQLCLVPVFSWRVPSARSPGAGTIWVNTSSPP